MVHIFGDLKPKPLLFFGQEAKSVHKPHGHFIMDGMVVADTLQCVHCLEHFIVVKGSGTRRGWCDRSCKGPTCGKKECIPCIPFERKLEECEDGKRDIL